MVLWNDGLGAKTFRLTVDSSKPVRITEAVPKKGIRRGTAVRHPDQAFNVTVRQPPIRMAEIELQPTLPVYVELLKRGPYGP